MKKIFLLIVLLCIPVNSGNLKIKDVVNDIFKNKSHYLHILELILSEKPFSEEQALTSVFEGKTPDDNYYNFLLDFLRVYGTYKGRNPRTNEQFYDSLYVVTISRFLCLEPKKYSGVINTTLDHLLKDPPFQLLYALSDSIKPYLECIPADEKKFYLLSLLKLDKNEKDKILNYENQSLVPLAVRARLGDTKAEKTLIEHYNNEKDYRQKARMVSELIMAGTENCLKNLIIHFNEPIFDEVGTLRDSCTSESIRYPIIKGFKRYFPFISLFRGEFAKVDTVRLPEAVIVIAYLQKFKAWAYVTYNINPIDPDPKPILFWSCKIQ